MLGRLNDPDECEAACGDGAVCVSSHNVAHMGNLVRDTNTSSP
jgi:hypothetical protein